MNDGEYAYAIAMAERKAAEHVAKQYNSITGLRHGTPVAQRDLDLRDGE